VLFVAALCLGAAARADVPEDSVPPASSFDSGPATTTEPLPTGLVTGTATDDASGIDSVTITFISLAPGRVRTAEADLSCDADHRLCAFSTPAPNVPGAYEVSAEATDRAHNVESSGPSMTVLVL